MKFQLKEYQTPGVWKIVEELEFTNLEPLCQKIAMTSQLAEVNNISIIMLVDGISACHFDGMISYYSSKAKQKEKQY